MRALQVVAAFRTSPRLALSELSRRTGLFKSTLLRILATLEQSGFVMRLADGQYGLGGIVYELGAGYVAAFRLEEIIKPALARLSEATGESAAFYVRLGEKRQCLFRVDSPQTVRAVIVVGQILDLDGAATSVLLNRHAGSAERPAAMNGYERLCLATSGIGDPQTASVAAPVFDTRGFLGVVNVSGPVNRFTAANVARFRSELARVAARVSSALGGIGMATGASGRGVAELDVEAPLARSAS
ncbi:MAG: helix-turn-helix domain-containing protein [Alphaproteobacteria bacterium]|nr:helix-turn-helix domain-containing protein [Alphaproteobacteria bacterium]